MNWFSNVKLAAHKGLTGGALTELGKINVICGPNNSGKTTVLECLADTNKHMFSVPFDEGMIEKMESRYLKGNQWTQPHYADGFARSINGVLKERTVWYNDESAVFARKFASAWSGRFGGVNFDQNSLEQAFQARFPARPRVVFIPAKRRLETEKKVAAFEQIQPGGVGVLNYLFGAKNQDETSDERKAYELISSAFQEISGGFEFEVFLTNKTAAAGNPPQTNVELKFRKVGSRWIHADDCGMGLQELLIILYFALASAFDVILIEEMETHLHPEVQRRLIGFLRQSTEKQFFISTHSSVLLNTQFADRVFMCRMSDGVTVTNVTNRAAALSEMGYSIADNLLSDLVVLCEGPKDKLVLDEFFQKMGISERGNIKVWPLGGDIMDQLDLTVFQEAHKLIALIDGDPGSSVVRKRFIKRCEELNIQVVRLKRYAMENYFTLEAIRKVMKGQVPQEVTVIDHDRPVGEQLGFEVKKVGGRIAKEMTLGDIQGTDLEGFLNLAASVIGSKGGA